MLGGTRVRPPARPHGVTLWTHLAEGEKYNTTRSETLRQARQVQLPQSAEAEGDGAVTDRGDAHHVQSAHPAGEGSAGLERVRDQVAAQARRSTQDACRRSE